MTTHARPVLIPAGLEGAGLDPYAFRVYAHLAWLIAEASEVQTTVTSIAAGCGMSIVRARMAVRELERRRFVETAPRYSPDGARLGNAYRLLEVRR